MKKFSYMLLGAAALTLASCANEDLVTNGNADGTAMVTINLSAPQIKSRAYSDGQTAKNLQYAVYKVSTDESTGAKSYTHMSDLKGTATMQDLKQQVSFKLVTNHDYALVFWADSGTTPYSIDFASDGATMTINYVDETGTNRLVYTNDELLDAFFKTEEIHVNGDITKDIILTRPFAQINVGTSDLSDAAKAGYKPAKSHIKVSDVYSKLDLISGTVSVPYDGGYDYIYKEIPENENFPVADPSYEYLAMVYALVDYTTSADEKHLVDVEFDVVDINGEPAAQNTVGSVPVQRNHRTNIYGELLTSNVIVNVEINPIYDEPDYEPDGLQLAGIIGGSYNVPESATYNDNINYYRDGILNLDENTLTMDDALIVVRNGSTLTINGPGEISRIGESSTLPSSGVYVKDGTINITGGTFTSNGVEAIIIEKGWVNISGGYFAVDLTSNGVNYTLNCIDAGYNAGEAGFVVTGGIFEEFDPANSMAEPKGPVNWVKEGYKSVPTTINGKNCFVVVPNDAVLVSDINDITSALAAGETYLLFSQGNYDFTKEKSFYDEGNGRFTLTLNSEYTLDGNGSTFEGKYSPNFHGATVKNLNFQPFEDGQVVLGSFQGNFINCNWEGHIYSEGGISTFEGCTFTNNNLEKMAFHNGIVNGEESMKLNNCTITGRCDFGGNGSIVFNNCTINTLNSEWFAYGNCTLIFKNCVIDYPENIKANSDTGKVVIE